MLNSCASVDRAATQTGTRAARVTLPFLPDDCRAVEPHAPVKVGDDAVSIIKRERLATDRANSRVTRCAEHYDGVARSLR